METRTFSSIVRAARFAESQPKPFLSVGTRSLLFGAHQFLIHPFFVCLAWHSLYGFPNDPRLWIAFLVHDIGYFGLRNIDGIEGERHPELGARIMGRLFGQKWDDFCRYHSRFYAEKDGRSPSRLCAADKLAIALVPKHFYLFLVKLTGELDEYMGHFHDSLAGKGKYSGQNSDLEHKEGEYGSVDHWHSCMISTVRAWVRAYNDRSRRT
jgi:hypothetical protein